MSEINLLNHEVNAYYRVFYLWFLALIMILGGNKPLLMFIKNELIPQCFSVYSNL